MAARATDRARRRLSRPDRPRGGPPGAAPRPRGSSSQRDRESVARAPRLYCERSRPTALVTMHGVDPSQFRQLLGRFATGVTVVTTRERSGKPIGMTASSVASVSLDPPLVLVSVARDNDMHPALKAAEHFVLNVLAADQEAISRRLDRKSTRLNSSHSSISYAVFCLKKKRDPRSPPSRSCVARPSTVE